VLVVDGAHPVAAPLTDDHGAPPVAESALGHLFHMSKTRWGWEHFWWGFLNKIFILENISFYWINPKILKLFFFGDKFLENLA
jgi:hypothetical protein